MTEKQGKRANEFGSRIEDALADFLRSIAKDRNFEVRTQEFMGTGIYGGDIKADIFITGHAAFPSGLAIESKWQDQSGSIDEKFPYLVANIIHCYKSPVIIVADGGGCREGARRWLKEQVDGQRIVAVHTLAEAYSWAMRNL